MNLGATNQQRLQIYARALITKLAQSTRYKDRNFNGVPLQTQMIAEAFEEEFRSFYESEESKTDLEHKLDLLGYTDRLLTESTIHVIGKIGKFLEVTCL